MKDKESVEKIVAKYGSVKTVLSRGILEEDITKRNRKLDIVLRLNGEKTENLEGIIEDDIVNAVNISNMAILDTLKEVAKIDEILNDKKGKFEFNTRYIKKLIHYAKISKEQRIKEFKEEVNIAI